MHQITVNGHVFNFLGVEPYTRANGTQTFLNVWSTSCEHPACEVQWGFKTPAGDAPEQWPAGGNKHTAHGFSRTACADHRVFKAQDHAAGGRASARVSDTDVADIRRLAAEGVNAMALALWYPLTPGTIKEIIAGRRRPAAI